jgi:hypothetical protein
MLNSLLPLSRLLVLLSFRTKSYPIIPNFTMKLIISALLATSAAAFAPAASNSRASVAVQESKADLEVLAKELNPLVGYFDPLQLGSDQFWEQSNDATIGFLREAEIKHGRIAMFAFVGYIVHANGIKFPWPMEMDGTPFPTVTSAPEAWDQISDAAKWQIFTFIGFLEFVSTSSSQVGDLSVGIIEVDTAWHIFCILQL